MVTVALKKIGGKTEKVRIWRKGHLNGLGRLLGGWDTNVAT